MEAISVSPSQNWDGNNGPWSSFALRIGRPAQVIYVLPATSKSEIWVASYDLCPYIPAVETVDDCRDFRGGLYDYTDSLDSRKLQPPDNAPLFELPFESEQLLGYEGNASVVTDVIGLGGEDSGGEVLLRQVIANFSYTEPFLATGLLGLSDQPANVTGPTDIHLSPLSTLQETNKAIPSKFWAYNAGARYLTDPRAYASLTLGGYDAARGGDLEDALEVPMRQYNPRDLVVTVQAVSTGTGDDRTHTLESGVDAYIDSVVPDFWLPVSACEIFEDAFNLQWNETYQMYLLDEAQLDQLFASRAKVTLTLASPDDPTSTIEISLAHQAFGLQALWPLAGIDDDTALYYFPLKRANISSQYYLGHAFLQEAYLAADYDRSVFYLSQANLTTEESKIKTVYPPGHGGFGKGAIAGIAVGVVVLLLIVASVVAWFICRPRWRKRRNSRYRAKVEAQNYGLPDTQLPNSPEMEMHEYYAKRPLSPESDHKQELDATTTARGSTTSRAEMESPSQSSLGSPRGKGTPRRSSYGFPGSPAELESRSPRMMHSRTASGSSIEPMSPLSGVGRRGLEPHEEVHEMP